METVFTKEIQAGLDKARLDAMKKSSRLRVSVDGRAWPVLRMWKTGFALEANVCVLRGLVDIYDGSRHLFQCLIITSADEAGERRYEFKRATAISEQPAADFEVDATAPVGLIGQDRQRGGGA